MTATKKHRMHSEAMPQPKGRAGCAQPAARRDEDIAPYLKSLRSLRELLKVHRPRSTESFFAFIRVIRGWPDFAKP